MENKKTLLTLTNNLEESLKQSNHFVLKILLRQWICRWNRNQSWQLSTNVFLGLAHAIWPHLIAIVFVDLFPLCGIVCVRGYVGVYLILSGLIKMVHSLTNLLRIGLNILIYI